MNEKFDALRFYTRDDKYILGLTRMTDALSGVFFARHAMRPDAASAKLGGRHVATSMGAPMFAAINPHQGDRRASGVTADETLLSPSSGSFPAPARSIASPPTRLMMCRHLPLLFAWVWQCRSLLHRNVRCLPRSILRPLRHAQPMMPHCLGDHRP
ncbi:hypothetical protein, partial [Aromatoleum aromaticum]|uniref:hypothetical protein n=1 Tax=Aromatoleum aromaticum TaxID=551760 RepID=UPI001B7CDEF4